MNSYLNFLTSFYFLLILILLSECDCELSCTESREQVITCTLGGVAELPCFLPNLQGKDNCFRTEWLKYTPASAKPKIILRRSLLCSLPNYSWQTDSLKAGNLSLTLKNVNKTDSGLYSCVVWAGWECVMATNVTLKVKECLALPPVTAQPSSTVILPCRLQNTSKDTQSVQVTWKLVQGNKQSPLLQYPPSSKMSSQIPRSMNFLVDPRSGDASLKMSNVTHSDTNWYRCEWVVGGSAWCYEVRLDVKDFGSEENTFQPSTVTVKQNVTDEQNSSQSTDSWTTVGVASFLVLMFFFMTLVGLTIYVKRCRSAPVAIAENDVHSESYYSNVEFQNSVHVLHTFYTTIRAVDHSSCDEST